LAEQQRKLAQWSKQKSQASALSDRDILDLINSNSQSRNTENVVVPTEVAEANVEDETELTES